MQSSLCISVLCWSESWAYVKKKSPFISQSSFTCSRNAFSSDRKDDKESLGSPVNLDAAPLHREEPGEVVQEATQFKGETQDKMRDDTLHQDPQHHLLSPVIGLIPLPYISYLSEVFLIAIYWLFYFNLTEKLSKVSGVLQLGFVFARLSCLYPEIDFFLSGDQSMPYPRLYNPFSLSILTK